MLTFTSQITRQSLSTSYRCNQYTVSSLVLFLAAYSSGAPAQTAFAGGTGSAGTIFASSMYSPPSTVWTGRSVAIGVATDWKPPSSASPSVKGLNSLTILPFGSVTHTTPGNSVARLIPGFVSSQVQTAGVNVATSFISTLGALNPNPAQEFPVTPAPQVEAAATSSALSEFSCSTGSITGSGSDSCTVKLTKAATKGGQSVRLASSNAAVTVPHTVTVPAKATSARLTASVSSVTSERKVTITASAGGVSKSFVLQLNAAVPTLTIEPLSLTFGHVTMDTSSSLPVTLASTGTVPVSVKSATLTGAGFTMSGATFPVTLNPGLAVKVEVRFEPTAALVTAGQLTIQSNSLTNARAAISLSGTGENTPHEVTLSWEPPSSSTAPKAVGYDVYRLTSGSSAFRLLNSSVDAQTTYVDSTVQAGLTYDYVVTSVSSSGAESAPSNEVAVTIP